MITTRRAAVFTAVALAAGMLAGGAGVAVARADFIPWVSRDGDLARHMAVMPGAMHMGADSMSGMMDSAGMMDGTGMVDGGPSHDGHHPTGSPTPTSAVVR